MHRKPDVHNNYSTKKEMPTLGGALSFPLSILFMSTVLSNKSNHGDLRRMTDMTIDQSRVF